MKIEINELNYAPIILFVYNRLDHARKVVEALKKCPESLKSELFIYSDAPKNEKAVAGVKEVRDYIHKLDGFKRIAIIERSKNWGIEKSEIDAITTIINRYGKAIMLEDDIIVGPYFLRFINNGLNKYKTNSNVFSVTGYSFIDSKKTDGLNEYGFIQIVSAWGWGTWADRWAMFRKDIDKQDVKAICNKRFREKFDMGFHYSDMLYKQYIRNALTWDVLWYWTSFSNNGLTLIPARTMVNNIGMDGSGVHFANKEAKNRIEFIEEYKYSDNLPDTIAKSLNISAEVENSLRLLSKIPSSGVSLLKWNAKEWLKWFIRRCQIENRKG